jgi:glutamate dehydrogenase (NAD(P)+)
MGATNAILDDLYSVVGVEQLRLIQGRCAAERPPTRLRELTGYRAHMTGLGVSWAAQALLGSLQGARVAVQGFGAVGAGAAVRFAELGAVVTAVSDLGGATMARRALPVQGMIRDRRRGEVDPDSLPGWTHRGPAAELFGHPADVLVLGAASGSVGREQAAQIVAPVVVEGANFGLTDGAREILAARGVRVIPDIIANSSSAAMVALQLASGDGLRAPELWERIRVSIVGAVRQAHALAQRDGTTMRSAWIAHVDSEGR